VLSQLVGKVEKECLLTMSTSQQALYMEKLQQAAKACVDVSPAGGGQGRAGSRRGAASAASSSSTAAPNAAVARALPKSASSLFAGLRKAANHPLLLHSRYTEAQLERVARAATAAEHYGERALYTQVRAELDMASDYGVHLLCAELGPAYGLQDLMLDQETLLDSAKMTQLRTLLPQLKKAGHRVLIFSQAMASADDPADGSADDSLMPPR